MAIAARPIVFDFGPELPTFTFYMRGEDFPLVGREYVMIHPMFGRVNGASAFNVDEYADGIAGRAFAYILRFAYAYDEARKSLQVLKVADATKSRSRLSRPVAIDREHIAHVEARIDGLYCLLAHSSNLFFALAFGALAPEEFDNALGRLRAAELLEIDELPSITAPDVLPAGYVE